MPNHKQSRMWQQCDHVEALLDLHCEIHDFFVWSWTSLSVNYRNTMTFIVTNSLLWVHSNIIIEKNTVVSDGSTDTTFLIVIAMPIQEIWACMQDGLLMHGLVCYTTTILGYKIRVNKLTGSTWQVLILSLPLWYLHVVIKFFNLLLLEAVLHTLVCICLHRWPYSTDTYRRLMQDLWSPQ